MPRPSLPFDLDDVLAYKTSKTVRIRDRRLGFAKLMITIAIFVYVVIFEAIIRQGYLKREVPQGAVMTNLRRHSSAPYLSDYCSSTTDPVQGEDKLPCEWLDEIDTLYPPGEELGSLFITTRISYANRSHEVGCDHLIYTGTGSNVQLVDKDTHKSCTVPPVYDEVKQNDYHYYVAEIENFTMLWSHAVYGPITQTVRMQDELEFAEMEMNDNDDIEFDDPDRGTESRATIVAKGYGGITSGDIVSINTFLHAADLEDEDGSLRDNGGLSRVSPQSKTDACLTASTDNLNTSECDSGCHWVGPRCSHYSETECTNDASCVLEGTDCWPITSLRSNLCTRNSIRYDGAVFLVMIRYETPKLTVSDMGYEYNVRYIDQAEYKLITKVNDGTTVTYLNRHGIRILFVQTGFITRFSFVELLKTLVAGVALFAVASIVVEKFIMKVLPSKHVYENYKYLTSEDFSVVNVSKENPFGGLTSDDFVYGVNKPGATPDLSAADKNSQSGEVGIAGATPLPKPSSDDGKEMKPTEPVDHTV